MLLLSLKNENSYSALEFKALQMLPLILLHGALGSAAQMAPLAGHLRSTRDIHVVELEGHGDTPAPDDTFAIDHFADQVRRFLEQHDIERAAFFGYSMGGYVALRLAAETPNVASSVATLGTKLAWTPEVAARETSRLDPVTIRAKVPKFADALEWRHAGAGGWETLLARTAALMTELGRQPTVNASVLSRISQPTRLMVGDRDNVVTIDETAAAARRLSSGELCVLPGTPHPFEQVSIPLLATLLIDFFDTRTPT
jgi:pimeloyl-ACP methyl ester carboxylesterase